MDSLLQSGSHDRVLDVWRGLWQQMRGLPGYWSLVLLSAVSALFSMPILLSSYLGFAIGQMQYSMDWVFFNILTTVMVLAVFMGLSAERHVNAIAARMNSRICQSLVSRLWWRLNQINSIAFHRLDQSEIVSRLTDMMETVQKHQLLVIQQLIKSVFVVLVTLLILLSHHFAFVGVVAFFVFVTCYVPILIAKTADPDIATEPSQLAQINGLVTSSFDQQITLRFSPFLGITQHFSNLLQQLALTQAGKWLRWNMSFNVKVTLNLLSHITLLGVGGQLYFNGSIALADLVVVYMLSSMVIPRLDNLYKIYNYLQSLRVGYTKLSELHGLQVVNSNDGTTFDKQSSSRLEVIKSISFSNVGYTFGSAPFNGKGATGKAVFNGLNLHFELGRKYFVCGRSGSGKSTLLNLVLGWQSPSEGNVLVNETPLGCISLPDYWQQIALQDQSNLVLGQYSVLDNIALFSDTDNVASLPRFQKAVQVLAFEPCLHKPVNALSGGELQKLSFIRSYIKPAQIYIFDEATAALDKQAEQKVLNLILDLSDAIVIFVSHHQYLATPFDEVIDLSILSANSSVSTSSTQSIATENRVLQRGME